MKNGGMKSQVQLRFNGKGKKSYYSMNTEVIKTIKKDAQTQKTPELERKKEVN